MKKIFLLTIMICVCFSCGKKLDIKPNSALVLPKTVQDFENLLDNTAVMNTTPGLAQLSSDEYFIPSVDVWQSLNEAITRNAYIWQSDIYEGNIRIVDWTAPYAQIFYCNSILDVLATQDINNEPEKKRIKGWALFSRAYAFYSLASIFARAYDTNSAGTDLGIPLKLTSDITAIVQRSTVQQSYDQIVKDALESSEFLQQDIIADKRNRPSRIASYALLSRVYLSMRQYVQAEIYADKCLALYKTLIDYNSLGLSGGSSFTYNSDETIYFSHQGSSYPQTTFSSGGIYGVDTTLIKLYPDHDLRKSIYFTLEGSGTYSVNKGINSALGYPFTGLATDEIYLIKAECLARRGQKDDALSFLNTLVKTRMVAGTFVNETANSAAEALEKVLIERRKALVWRSLRWTDLKRLNKEGRNITLTRNLSGKVYTLEANSPKYVLPIPEDEIALSGIQQNIR